jgi:predicted dehydrogenase
MKMKIGIIGMSAGNAHPYSWSSIINGQFDAAEITRVGYPAVAAYLQANSDTIGITDARVTHVWTQDPAISRSIAHSAGISHVVTDAVDMIRQVDAVILSRDDPGNHREMAHPFIEAGIPIFIDKPLAGTLDDLSYFASASAAGKLIMSCSSMRYSTEARNAKIEFPSLGKLELIVATGKKDWLKYGVHMLECVSMLLDDASPATVKHISEQGKDIVHLTFPNGLQVLINLFYDISPTFQLTVFGMFRDNIIEFIRSVNEGKSRLDFSKTESIIRTLLAASESLQQGGATIRLT